jgi:hypothetical protein
VTAARASIRRDVRIRAAADDIWAYVGDAGRLAEWWPGVTSCAVDGDIRTITMGSGLAVPEKILLVDDIDRRFQYRIIGPLFREHTSTIDVHDLGDGTCLVVYSIDAEPHLRDLIEGGS